MEHNFEAFVSREARQNFVLRIFPEIFSQESESAKILDVGCDENIIKQRLGRSVYGVDVSGNPDRVVDLEKESLSFAANGEYQTIVCLEVLEHIDNLHQVFADLFRVSSKYVLISLPNNSNLRKLLYMMRSGQTGKFYGLPHQKPTDRHKWFFSASEAIKFAQAHVSKNTQWNLSRILLHYNVIYEKKGCKYFKQSIISWIIHIFSAHTMAKEVFFLFEKTENLVETHSKS